MRRGRRKSSTSIVTGLGNEQSRISQVKVEMQFEPPYACQRKADCQCRLRVTAGSCRDGGSEEMVTQARKRTREREDVLET
jgi:ferredoxin